MHSLFFCNLLLVDTGRFRTPHLRAFGDCHVTATEANYLSFVGNAAPTRQSKLGVPRPTFAAFPQQLFAIAFLPK